MTGMGRDGAAKLAELYREGSRTIGQDEDAASCTGCPRSLGVRRRHEQVSLDRMAETINRYGKEIPADGNR
jgi:two-component system chemotaxis response regulator CheB